jgi:hypothetical protein
MPALRFSLLLAAVLATLGCRKQAGEPHGSPQLLQVMWWEANGPPRRVWSLDADADAGVVALAPATAAKIDFVFSRKLDGARIEDSVAGQPSPKPNPPITVGWPDMATVMSNPPFAADVFYNSLPDWGPGTTYAFVRPRFPGFPSGTPVTFSLDPNGLTNVYGEPMDGPTEITVTTAPLTVTLPNSTVTVSTGYMAPITFSTSAPGSAALRPFIQVGVGATTLSFDVEDANDRRRVFVIPKGCPGGWPPGVRVDITVAAGAPDGFGRPLAAAATGSFMTAPIGGCGFGDAGTNDAGPDDGAVADIAPDDAQSN